MRTYVRRLVGALVLDPAAYEDVEADSGATLAAGLTVLLSSVATAIGAQGLGQSLSNVPSFALVTLVGWMAWALLTFEIGARLLPGARTHADVGELLRTLGFAAAPGILLGLAALPGLAVPLFATVPIWMLATMVMAVRQALDYSSMLRAVAVCVLGWLLSAAGVIAIGLVMGTTVR
jgi:hypothetical protein